MRLYGAIDVVLESSYNKSESVELIRNDELKS